jgi:hypothetical protein
MFTKTTQRLSGSLGLQAGTVRWLFLVVAVIAFCVTPLLASSKIVHRWVLTGVPMPKLKKILVIAVLENYLIRQELEDEMERLLAKSHVEGVRSHMVLPPRNELAEGELKQWIKDGDYDAVLVVRPLESRKETEEVVTGVSTVYFVPPAPYYHFWPYWNMAMSQSHIISSYVKEHTIVYAEFNLYNNKDEKLLWSGETETLYSTDFDKVAKDYAKAIVKQMKKDKVLTSK